ncbi:MAG: hypothetical protein ACRBHB_21270 [Arenicella sp.]
MAEKKQTIFQGETLVVESTDDEGKCYQTPLFFVQKDQSVYIRVPASSPKVDRVFCNNTIKLAATDSNGNRRGDWVLATASVHAESEFPWLFSATLRKYGLKPIFARFMKWLRRGCRHKNYCVLELQMENGQNKR